MKTKKIFLILALVFVGSLCSLSAYASTSDALVGQMLRRSNTAQNGASYDAPFLMPAGNVDSTNGAVDVREAELTLPGKNGLDLTIYRTYDSYNSQYALKTVGSDSGHIYIGVPYTVYRDDMATHTYYIAYESEADIQDVLYTDKMRFDNPERDSVNNTQYLCWNRWQTGTEVRLEWDKELSPIELREDTSNYVSRQKTGENLSLDYGWYISVPSLIQQYFVQSGSTTKHYIDVELDDGKRESIVYSYSESDTGNEEIASSCSFLNSDTVATLDFSMTPIEHVLGFEYNLALHNGFGKTYYFYISDTINGSDGEIVAVCDQFNNAILYDCNDTNSVVTITDTYGRKITLTSQGIVVEAGNIIKEITYETEQVLDTAKDPHGYYSTYHTYYFKKGEYTGQNQNGEKVETTYKMKQKTLEGRRNKIDANHAKTFYLVQCQYPTGASREYIYEETPTAPLYYKNSENDVGWIVQTSDYKMYRVVGEKTYENGVLKEDIQFSYAGTWEMLSEVNWDYTKQFIKTQTLENGNTKTTTLTYDCVGRLISEELLIKNGSTTVNSQKTLYHYDAASTVVALSSETNRAKYLRRKPVSNIQTFQDGKLISSQDVKYNEKSRNPERQEIGEKEITYTYDSAYQLPLTVTENRLGKGNMYTQNTLTADNKAIAVSKFYADNDVKSTVRYTYNQDGTLASQEVENGAEDIRTTYEYNYANDSSYTVTQTVHDVEDAEGVKTDISTISAYDSLGRLISVTDGNDNLTRYEYDMLGQVTVQRNPDGSRQQIAYQMAQNNLTATDEEGYQTTYDYSPMGHLEKVYIDGDPSKLLASYTYDNLGRKVTETAYKDAGEAGLSNEYTYDDLNRITTITTKDGTTVLDVACNTYEVLSEITNLSVSAREYTTIDVTGYKKVEVVVYDTGVSDSDGTADIIVQKDGVQVLEEIMYAKSGESFIMSIEGAETLGFKTTGGSCKMYLRFLSESDENNLIGGALQKVTTSYQGDDTFKNPTRVTLTDGYGNLVSESYYDGTVSEDTLLTKTVNKYDYQGNVIQSIGGRTYMENLADYTVKTEYDHAGRPTKVYRADGAFITNTYDSRGNLIAQTDYMGSTTQYTYDKLNRVIKTTMPFEGDETAETLTFYDNNGNVIKTKVQNNAPGEEKTYAVTEHAYTNRDFLLYTMVNDGTRDICTQYNYDSVGNLRLVVSGHSAPQVFGFNNLPEGAGGVLYTYDRFGNVIKEKDSEGREETATYNYMGLPVSQTDKNGVTTTTTYNGYGSPLTVTKGIFIQQYDYSANNMLRQVAIFADENTGVGYQYDALGRVKVESSYAESQGFMVKNYTYDADGNRKSFTLMQNGTAQQNVTYAYDILNRPTSVNFGTSGVGGVSYTYDQNGRLLSESGGQNTATYTYNKAGLVTSLTNSNGADYTYAYTLDGNQIQKTDSANGTTNYTYDAIGQLKEETTVKDGETTLTTYAYDSRGNRVGVNQGGIISQYTYDTTNRLVEKVQGVGEETQTKTTYTYDQNGNLTFRMAETLGSVARDEALGIYDSQTKEGTQSMQSAMMTKFTYDDFGQLISLETENDKAEYTYDAIGRRNSKTVNGTYRAQIWDGDNIIAEMDENKTITHQYLRANKLIAQKIGDEIGYYTYDAHGSVTGMDGEAYAYDAFGNLQGNVLKDNPFLYCGEYYDAESGFVYLRNRYYDPSLGRFTTEDPYWNPDNMIYGDEEDNVPNISAIRQSTNLYVYCTNNPVTFVDPSGYITDEERAMYENGEMAPGAYTFLMLCTYYYYLQDNDEGREYWSGKAQAFRDSGYTDTGDWFYNWTLTQMSTRPSGETISEDEHYFRNELNIQFEWDEFEKLNERLPENLKWRELPWQQSIFHKFSFDTPWQGNNRKYVSACEHFEIVYTKENYLVDAEFNSTYMGTYNYYGPTQADQHKKYDVDPYFKYGNVR